MKFKEIIGETKFPFLMLLPTLIIILAVVAFPLIYSLYLSFTDYRLLSPESGIFIGFKNYVKLLQDPLFYRVLGNTILLLVVAVNTEFGLGLGIALLLNREFKARGIVRTLFMLPMMFAPILIGVQFRWLFNDLFGLVNHALIALGVIEKRIAWLVHPTYAMLAIMITEIWQNTPFMAILLLAGLQALPKDPFEAARIDGASSLQIFRHITLPLLKPIIVIALTIRSLDVVRIFDIIQIMTGGGPAYRTEVIGTFVYRLAIPDREFAYGLSVSYVSIIITLIFAIYLFRQLQKIKR